MLSKRVLATLHEPIQAIAKRLDLPVICAGKQLRHLLGVQCELGRGQHGTVWAAGDRLALKSIPLQEQALQKRLDEVTTTLDELYGLLACNAALSCVPHFPKTLEIHLLEEEPVELLTCWLEPEPLAWGIVMERCDGSLEDLEQQPLPKGLCQAGQAAPLLIAMQLFAAFYTLGSCFQLCNNDAYGRNILYKLEKTDQHYLYCLGQQQYLVPSAGLCWKLIDFGLSTHSSLQQPRVQAVEAMIQHPAGRHVSTIKRFPRYGRDLSAALHALTLVFPNSSWLQSTCHYLNRSLRNGALSTCIGLSQFIQHVASSDFLRGTGLPPDLLQARLGKCQELKSQGCLLVCNIDGANVKALRSQVQTEFGELRDLAMGYIWDSSSTMSSSISSE